MRKVWSVFIFFVMSTAVHAQAPQGINYQAVARGSNGASLNNQTISVKFEIYGGNPNTAPLLYSEIYSGTTTNQFGLFTRVIGQGTPSFGTFSSINWASGNTWLQVSIDPANGNNFTIIGASQFMSVPYALYAQNGPAGPSGVTGPTGPGGTNGTNGANGSTGPTGPSGSNGQNGATGPSGIDGVTGPTGSQAPLGPQGPTGPQGATGVQGPTGSVGPTGANGVTGPQGPTGANGATGSSGPIGATGPTGLLNPGTNPGNTPFWNGSAWVVTSNNIFNNGGNVGIGNAAPGFKLDVNGTINTNSGFNVNGPTGSGNNLRRNGSVFVPVLPSQVYSDIQSFLPGGASAWTLSTPNIFPTTLTNLVGIGTNAPGYKLHVVNGSSGGLGVETNRDRKS